MENTDLGILFKKITITSILKAISSFFLLETKINYSPPYQRGYIWTKAKATYLIESILLHGEIPPIVLYKKSEAHLEVIDGRQRWETIHRFLNDAFCLQHSGLEKLQYLAGLKFSQFDKEMQECIRTAKLRCMVIEAKNENDITDYQEERLKRELFKRCNIGLSPLKKEEVYKAQYLHDGITAYFKKYLKQDASFYKQISGVFNYKSRKIETLLQHIRELLVLSDIPINKYSGKAKEETFNQCYANLSYYINKSEESVELLFNTFKKNVYYLAEIKEILQKEYPATMPKLIAYDCIYWAISICKKENISSTQVDNQVFKNRLVSHVIKHAHSYSIEKSNYMQHINNRHCLISSFFSSQLPVVFDNYLKTPVNKTNDAIGHGSEVPAQETEECDFTKETPTSSTIIDILEDMKRGKFNIRPPYQREEVMTILKASLLIESILLGIKLPPIYLFVRSNGVKEVIDGQQRLLAIIGFLGEKYLDEHGQYSYPQKKNFALNLTSPLIPDINKKKFKQLLKETGNHIYNYVLDIIEIKEINNKNFKPEELYKRLNYKPFPIKDNTFEYWNSYVDSDIVNAVKDIYNRNKWLYLRKQDNRMLNEELIMCLCYLNFTLGIECEDFNDIKEILDFYEYKSHIVVRIKNKKHITQILEDPNCKGDFLLSLNDFEKNFIEKLKYLTDNPKGKTKESFRSQLLDSILHKHSARISMNFFALWIILKGVPVECINDSKFVVLSQINKILSMLKETTTCEKLEEAIIETWKLKDSTKQV